MEGVDYKSILKMINLEQIKLGQVDLQRILEVAK